MGLSLPRGSRYGLGLRVRVLQPHLWCNSFFYDARVRGRLPFRPVAVHANYVLSASAKQALLARAIEELAPLRPPPKVALEEMDRRWDGWWAPPGWNAAEVGTPKDPPPRAAAGGGPRALQPA